MKCILSKIVRNFELSISEKNKDIEIFAEMVLRSENGIILNIHKREDV